MTIQQITTAWNKNFGKQRPLQHRLVRVEAETRFIQDLYSRKHTAVSRQLKLENVIYSRRSDTLRLAEPTGPSDCTPCWAHFQKTSIL